jgi:hypothetical protein
MKKKELVFVFTVVWFVVSGVILMLLVTPFVVPGEIILQAAPKCEWKVKYNKECPVCGITTAFIRISNGEFHEALISNKYSLTVYFIFAMNELFLITFLINRFLRKKVLQCRYSVSFGGYWLF